MAKMMRTLRSSTQIATILGLLTLLSNAAWAQNLGVLAGYVYDQGGTALKGITVTITSPTQIGGAKTDTTNDQGAFRFAGLTPGRFRVSAAAPKLRTTVAEGIRVNADRTTDIDLVMDVDVGGVEEIKVVEKTPTVNMRSTRVGEVFDQEFLESLPLASRTYQGVATLAAGVSDLDGDGNPQVRGASSFSNNYTVDGFTTTDPVTNTFGTNFSFNAISNLEISTAGGDAENAGFSGGNFNMVTKSGSNRFEFLTGVEYTDHHLRVFGDSRDRVFRRGRIDANVGGPIIRDKLWYYVSAEAWDGTSTLPSDPNFPDHPARHQYGIDSTFKLSWEMTPRNKVHLQGSVSPGIFNNVDQSPFVEPEAETRFTQRSEFLGLTWASQVMDELSLINRLGFRQQEFVTRPQSCQWNPGGCLNAPSQVDVLTGLQTQNGNQDQLDQRRDVQFSGRAEYSLTTRRLGNHLMRLTWDTRTMANDVRETVPGDATILNRGSERFRRSEYCSNDPKLSDGICRRDYLRSHVSGTSGLFTLSDDFTPTRYLSIKPGVAFHAGTSENDKGVKVTNMTAFTPHLSTTWDPTHNGKTKLQATFRGVADTGFLALARFTSRSLYSRQCTWDEESESYARDCRSSGGNDSTTVGLPCGPDGFNPDGTPCRTKLKPPRVWETTATAEREVMTGVLLGATALYRKFVNQWEDVETNGNWNDGGTALRREAPFKSGRSEFIFDLQTPDAAHREYRALTAYLRKREGRFKAFASYTLAKYTGSADASFAGTFLDNPGQTAYYRGPLRTDNRHNVKVQTTFAINSWLSSGLVYEYLTGSPYSRVFLDPVFNSFSRFQAQRGYDSQGNSDPTDDVPLRLPDVSKLDLNLRANLEPLIKQRLFVYVDYINVLAVRTPLSVVERDGAFFGDTTSRLPASSFNFGIQYRY
jgi:hypothetical protein